MDATSRTSPTKPRRLFIWLMSGILLVALIVTAVVWWQSRGANAVTREAATTTGPSPFVDAATVSPPAAFTETVTTSAIEATAGMTRDEGTGGRQSSGDTSGLYGGSGSVTVCDVAGLARFLADNPSQATAWAQIRGIETSDIAEHLRSLVAVYLTTDILVTNHGFDGTRATPYAAVLQSGTAVLVDNSGVPAVRCACGNPLSAAPQVDLASVPFSGDSWDSFATDAVVSVTPAGQNLSQLSVTDVTTGDLRDIPIRSLIQLVYLATSVNGLPESATKGTVHASSDAKTWTEVLSTQPLFGIDTSPQLAVAVGATTDGGGIIHTSTDGTTWSEAIRVTDPLVSVTYGNGQWVAVGNRSFAEESGAGDGSSGAVYRSTDAVKWERVATTNPYDNSELVQRGGTEMLYQSMRSVGYGAGTWAATASECAYRSCQLVQFTSTDTKTWTRHALDDSFVQMDVDHNGEQWGFVGGERDPAGIEVSMADKDRPLGLAGTSGDAKTWKTGATKPSRVVLTSLDAGADGWYAVDVATYGSAGSSPAAGGVYRSQDLQEWEKIGTVTAGITAIAVLPGGTTASAPTASASPQGTPVTTPATSVTQIHILTRGVQLVNGQDPSSVLAYEDSAASAIEKLTQALGEPSTTLEKGDGVCSVDSTVTTWKGFSVRYSGTDSSASWDSWLSGTGNDIPSVPVGVEGGITVGSTVAQVMAAYPQASRETSTHQGVDYDLVYVDVTGEMGTEIMATAGIVTSIGSPRYLTGDC